MHWHPSRHQPIDAGELAGRILEEVLGLLRRIGEVVAFERARSDGDGKHVAERLVGEQDVPTLVLEEQGINEALQHAGQPGFGEGAGIGFPDKRHKDGGSSKSIVAGATRAAHHLWDDSGQGLEQVEGAEVPHVEGFGSRSEPVGTFQNLSEPFH